jgi:hypothetical protein
MKFTATEAGFREGMGGASNSKSLGRYHYVLFGIQSDINHPENSGTYFEFDDQSNGATNSVQEVSMGDNSVTFKLQGGKSIEIDCDVPIKDWDEFKQGVRTVFGLLTH